MHQNTVKQYYFDHLAQLSSYSYFHFLTRLWLCKGDSLARAELDALYQREFSGRSTEQQYQTLLLYLTNPKQPTSLERQQYLRLYPDLRPFARDAFACVFAQAIWKLDLTAEFHSRWKSDQSSELAQQLLEDLPAINSLATYALNFLILQTFMYHPKEFEKLYESLFSVLEKAWLKIAEKPDGLQIISYFITHLIINDTLFYTRKLPEARRARYNNFLERVVGAIQLAGLSSVSVDCLNELIVCCNLVGSDKPELKSSVLQYVVQHKSSHGEYLVEPDLPEQTISDAEHRNVLFILGFGTN